MSNPLNHNLSPGNVARDVYNKDNSSINVTLVGSGSPSTPSIVQLSDGSSLLTTTTDGPKIGLDVNVLNNIELTISHVDDSIRLGDGTTLFTGTTVGPKTGLDVNLISAADLDIRDLLYTQDSITSYQGGNWNITNISGSVSLPTGASTSALQSSGNTTLSNIETLLSNPLVIDLPTGAATESKQDSIISSINNLLTDTQLRASPIDIQASSLPLPIGAATSSNQDSTNTKLDTIISSLSNLDVSLTDEPIKISGTEDGTPSGTEFTLVNNRRIQILAAKDRVQTLTYADFGTKDERITQIDYSASSIGSGAGFTARKTLVYTLVSNKYRRDSISWSLV